MKIRIATENDLDDICVLSDQINTTHHRNAPNIFSKPDRSERDRVFWLNNIAKENSVFFVIESDGKVQGFITARITENTEITFLVRKKVCRIGTIVVADTQQRKGLGKAMMQKIEQWALDAGADEIVLEVMQFNSNAQQFYDSIGYANQSHILSKSIVC